MMSGAPNLPSNQTDHILQQSAGGQYATVLMVDPVRQVATVQESNQSIHEEIPLNQIVGVDGEGHFGTPVPGMRCLLTSKAGFQAIESIIPLPTYFQGNRAEHDEYSDEVNTFLSLTGTPKLYARLQGNLRNFRSHRPSDLIAGDMGFRTAEGAAVYAGRGGIAGIKASDLAQVIVNQADDLTRVIGRNMEMLSDFGELTFSNVGGKTQMRLRGNATAADTYAGKYTFELVVGSGGTGFIDLKLLKKDGSVAFSFLQDQAGNQSLYTGGDQLTEIGGNHGVGIAGNERRVVGGSQEIDVDGTHVLRGSHINFGDTGGERAPMGEELVAYLESFVLWAEHQATYISGKPGSIMPAPAVPDFLSNVVKYVKTKETEA